MKTLSLHVDISDIIDLDEEFQKSFNVAKAYNENGIYEDKLNNFEAEIIFTNPNSCPIYYDALHFKKYSNLKYLVTASTGTIHINFKDAKDFGIKIISITNELDTLEKITSTAEHALALSLSALRRIPQSMESVKNGEWNYSPFIGRQLNKIHVGVVGFGRLGKMYCNFMRSLGSSVSVYDPYKYELILKNGFEYCSLEDIFKISNIISLHCHVTDETTDFINKDLLKLISDNAIIINTARGEIVNEIDLCNSLKTKNFYYFTDVLNKEYDGLQNSVLAKSVFFNKNIFITPHQGGMTFDARSIAYKRAAELLFEEIIEN